MQQLASVMPNTACWNFALPAVADNAFLVLFDHCLPAAATIAETLPDGRRVSRTVSLAARDERRFLALLSLICQAHHICLRGSG